MAVCSRLRFLSRLPEHDHGALGRRDIAAHNHDAGAAVAAAVWKIVVSRIRARSLAAVAEIRGGVKPGDGVVVPVSRLFFQKGPSGFRVGSPKMLWLAICSPTVSIK